MEIQSHKIIMKYSHTSYSPNLTWWNFWVFPIVKMLVKDKHFEWIQVMEVASRDQIKTLKKGFQKHFKKWNDRRDTVCLNFQAE